MIIINFYLNQGCKPKPTCGMMISEKLNAWLSYFYGCGAPLSGHRNTALKWLKLISQVNWLGLYFCLPTLHEAQPCGYLNESYWASRWRGATYYALPGGSGYKSVTIQMKDIEQLNEQLNAG